MDVFEKWQNEIDRLEIEKIALEKQQELLRRKMAEACKDFYNDKQNLEFSLCEENPSIEALELYSRYISNRFPLYNFGKFNVKELAEIVKYYFQFKTREKFDIVTVGVAECNEKVVADFSLLPHLYFIVGNDKSLEAFKKYHGLFVHSDKVFSTIDSCAYEKNLVKIEVDENCSDPLGIECLTGSSFDEKGMINYFDDGVPGYMVYKASLYKQVFGNLLDILSTTNNHTGIKDVLSFTIPKEDEDIAKILISLSIYKRNNNFLDFTKGDYRTISKVLFHEEVDIIGDCEKDFPRTLTYIPR